MKRLRLKALSDRQRQAWVAASAVFSVVFGLALAAMGAEAIAFADLHMRAVVILVLAVCWLVIVLLMRLYFQQIDDPSDPSSFPILRRNRKN